MVIAVAKKKKNAFELLTNRIFLKTFENKKRKYLNTILTLVAAGKCRAKNSNTNYNSFYCCNFNCNNISCNLQHHFQIIKQFLYFESHFVFMVKKEKFAHHFIKIKKECRVRWLPNEVPLDQIHYLNNQRKQQIHIWWVPIF